MHSQPPSEVRVYLLLAVSMFAGLFASSWLRDRLEGPRGKALPRSEQSLAVESPQKNASQ